MARRCLLLDLKSDPELIARYCEQHRPGGVPDAVLEAIAAEGVSGMEIYRLGDRLVMIVEAPDGQAPAPLPPHLAAAVLAWESQMDAYQTPAPGAEPGRKWTPAELIFNLAEHAGAGAG